MQQTSLNEEFFNENYLECSKKAHPIVFYQNYFLKEVTNFHKIYQPQELINAIQSCMTVPLDYEMLEELIDRLNEKQKDLTFIEFFKIFQEAEIVLILKALYMGFLLDRNSELLSRIENCLQDVNFSIGNKESKNVEFNVAFLQFLTFAGYLEAPFLIVIKYGQFLFESQTIRQNTDFRKIICEILLETIDELIEFEVYRQKGKERIFLGRSTLSLFYLDFSKKNTVHLKFSQNYEMVLEIDFKFSDRKMLKFQLDNKIRSLEKENSALKQEEIGFKNYLLQLLRPFDPLFDVDHFYKLKEIPIKPPLIFQNENFSVLEDKALFSRNLTANTGMELKELRPEREPQDPEGKFDTFNPTKNGEKGIQQQQYNPAFINEDDFEKKSVQRKIEQIISSNRNENQILPFEGRMENMSLWKKFLLRTDILAIIFVVSTVLLNTQRNLFLDVY